MNRLFNPLFYLVLVLFFSIGLFAQTVDLTAIDQAIEKTRTDWQIPGIAVAIVKDGKLIHAKGYGTRTIGKDEPVDENTLFAVASNSKAFTVSLLGILVDAGKLRWDDKVVDHLPNFQMFDPYVTREMTVRDLVTHRSGLPTFGGDHIWIGNSLSSDEILARLRHLEPNGLFRSSYHYQNLMFMVAGMVYEKISGEKWGEAVEKHLFKPLGMNRSNTSIRALANDKNVASPHEPRNGKTVPVAYDLLDNVAPAAAVNASVADMSKWMQLHLNNGKVGDLQIISAKVVREMQAIYNPIPISEAAENLYGRKFSGAGMGWFISNYGGYKTVSHGGGMSGMISLQTLIPEADFGVMVVTNYAPDSPTRAITNLILDSFFQPETAEKRNWSAELLEQVNKEHQKSELAENELAAQRIKNTKPSLPLDAYTGTYFDAFSGNAEVRLENGNLVFDYNPRHLGDLTHWHADIFRVVWRDPIFDMPAKSFISFRINEKGEVVSLETSFYDPITFERKHDFQHE
ncbi:MAG: serine hydrolase [Calditrichia bacterium]